MQKILIVEDEKVLAEAEKEEFRSRGYDVKIAKDGQEGLELSRSFSPDIIVLDLILPRKGGLAVLKELKSDAELKEIPVVVLTNLAEDRAVKDAMDLGAVDYFVKTEKSIFDMVDKAENYLKK